MKNFEQVLPQKISDNVFELIGSGWMLITAGTRNSFNTMTASWGGFGILWNKPVAIIFVRPTRYTFRFIENQEYFSLSFFGEKYRDILKLCGTKSGREINKMTGIGLTPAATPNHSVAFEEARLILECKKKYHDDIDPGLFMDKETDKNYPAKDYHRFYIGEIINCFINKEV